MKFYDPSSILKKQFCSILPQHIHLHEWYTAVFRLFLVKAASKLLLYPIPLVVKHLITVNALANERGYCC